MRWMLLMIVAAAASAGDVLDCVEGRWLGRWVDVAATAYTPTNAIDSAYHESKGTRWRWILADGKTHAKRQPYGIAVKLFERDGKWRPALPFGTKVYIPTGYGYMDRSRDDERVFVIDDGSASSLYESRLDGLMHVDLRWVDTSDALRWAGPEGHQVLRVFIIEQELPPVEIPRTWPETIAEAALPPIPRASENERVIEATQNWGVLVVLSLLPLMLAVAGMLSAVVRR